MKAALIGHPVGHSLSPVIHNHWMAAYGIGGRYDAVDISRENLADGLRALVGEGYDAFNVTVPHKQSVMALCDAMGPEARAIGAVNTLLVDPQGGIRGENTDAFGFAESVRAAVPVFSFMDGPVLVLGAGGAARAVVHALRREGAPEVRITNRTRENAGKLEAAVYDWDDRAQAARDAVLVVNTTVLGMKGQPPLPFDVSLLPPSALVCDIVYNPLLTPLLAAARTRGLRTIDGLGMLLHQARAAFALWTGITPEIDDGLRAKLMERLS